MAIACAGGACGSSPTQTHSSTPPPDHMQAKRHCEYDQRNETADGYCFCDGFHGGHKPEPDHDYSHMVCVKTRHRSDGCPDDIKAGDTCTGTPARCTLVEGWDCGAELACTAHHWADEGDPCDELP